MLVIVPCIISICFILVRHTYHQVNIPTLLLEFLGTILHFVCNISPHRLMPTPSRSVHIAAYHDGTTSSETVAATMATDDLLSAQTSEISRTWETSRVGSCDFNYKVRDRVF